MCYFLGLGGVVCFSGGGVAKGAVCKISANHSRGEFSLCVISFRKIKAHRACVPVFNFPWLV